jgi:branched-chain amino acid transport system substrate-binding protein
MSAGLVGGILAGSAASLLAADKAIKIGSLFPMSGPGSYFGAQDKQGIELALEQLNKAGINGYKFEVQYEDSSCSPLPATQAAKRLLDQFKPDVVIGEECSDATLAVMPVMELPRFRCSMPAPPRSRSPIQAIPGRSASCRTK